MLSMRLHQSLSISALGFALIAAACASEQGAESAEPARASACEQAPGNGVYAEAFTQYMVGLTPTPRRFLSAAGTDSALPEAVFEGVQAKGPTYFYPGDEAARRVVREKLSSVGDWPTLLVLWRGNEVLSDSMVAIRLAGHYVGGSDDGTAAPTKTMHFACDTIPWQFVRTADVTTP